MRKQTNKKTYDVIIISLINILIYSSRFYNDRTIYVDIR